MTPGQPLENRLEKLATASDRAPGAASLPPGVVIAHSPHDTGRYLGTPGLALTGGGGYLATHDEFGPGVRTSVTGIYLSGDRGKSWKKISEIDGVGLHWANLFRHGNCLYLFGADQDNNTVILRSEDEGVNWTRPENERTGLLLRGSYHPLSPGTLVHGGKIWRANEYARPGVRWGRRFEAFMMSAPEDSDLLKSENWLLSNRIGYHSEWLDGRFGGWLEGNAVVDPDGEVANMLRVQFGRDRYTRTWDGYGGCGKAAIHHISRDGRMAEFDPGNDFVEFPGGLSRFKILQDGQDGQYWSLANYVPPLHRQAKIASERIRNTMALVCSRDLRNWEFRCIVLHEPDPLRYGFQYISWCFEGEDIIAVSRTSHPDPTSENATFGCDQAHDANYVTFHRFTGFRGLSMQDSVFNPAGSKPG